MQAKKLLLAMLTGMSCALAVTRASLGDPGDLRCRLSLLSEAEVRKLSSTPLNANNALVPQERYGDISTASLNLRWLGFAGDLRAAARYDDRDDARLEFLLRELYFAAPLGAPLQLTIGRRIFKWGTGYAFNPTGVVEPKRDAADPSDRLNRNQGRQVIALDAYFDSYSITILYANEVSLDDRLHWGRDELAARLYALIGNVDLSLVAHWRETERPRLGFNGAWTHGAHLELHAEFLGQLGTDRLYHRSLENSDTGIYFGEAAYDARYENSNRPFYQALLGGQYIFNSGVSLMAEYYTDRAGLTRDEWARWRGFTLAHRSRITQDPADPRSFEEFFNALRTLDEDGIMRHYGFARFYIPIRDSGLELIVLGNLVDQSGVVIPTYTYRFNANVSAWIRASYFGGAADSEFCTLFTQIALNAGVRVSL